MSLKHSMTSKGRQSKGSYFWIGGQYFVKLIQGLLLNKGIAYFLGIESYGHFSFFQNLFQMAQAVLNSSLSQAAIVRTSSDHSDDGTLPVIIIYIASAVSVLWLIMLKFSASSLVSVPLNLLFLCIYFLCFIFLSLDAYMMGILLKREKLKSVFFAMFGSVLVSGSLGFFLLHKFNILGAVLYLIIIPVISFLFTWMVGFCGNVRVVRKLERDSTKNVFGSFLLLSVVSAICYPTALYWIRSVLAMDVGITGVSYWQACLRISEAYTGVVALFFQRVYFVKAATAKEEDAIRMGASFNKILLVCSPFAIVAIYFLSPFVIEILFSKEFFPAAKYMPLFFLGDLFRFLSYPSSFLALAKINTKLFVGTEIFFTVGLVLFSTIGVKVFGFVGVALAYVLNSILYYAFWVFIKPRLKNL